MSNIFTYKFRLFDKNKIFGYNIIYSRVLYFVWIKMNVNTSSVAEEEKDILYELTDTHLKLLQKSAIEEEDYEKAAKIRDIFASRRLDKNFDKQDATKKLAEDELKRSEFKEKLGTEKDLQSKQDENKISELTAQLNSADEKIWSLEEKLNKLLEAQKENREETSQNLEDVLEAKKSGDPESFNKFLTNLTELLKKKWMLNEDSKKELLEYPENQISTMKTKLIKWRWLSKKTIKTADGKETTIKRPNVKINRHRRSRRKLNQVVKAFNWFKKDSDSAMKYILTQDRMGRVDTVTWMAAMSSAENRGRYNLMHKTWFVMSKAKFEEKFDKQQKKIIDQFKNNINPAEWSAEDTTIKWLEARMKRYKQEYMNKHY